MILDEILQKLLCLGFDNVGQHRWNEKGKKDVP